MRWFVTGSRRLAGAACAAVLLLPACTTWIHPVACGREPHSCGERRDVTFCENVALQVEGAGCPALGLTEGKHFCFISEGPCVGTHYAARDGGCVVTRYERVRQSFSCSAGTPTFAQWDPLLEE